MLQNTCKTLGLKKNLVYKIPLGGGKPYPASGLLMYSFELSYPKKVRRMAENGSAPPPPPREFRRHILSCRELKAKSFKKCLHSVLRDVSL